MSDELCFERNSVFLADANGTGAEVIGSGNTEKRRLTMSGSGEEKVVRTACGILCGASCSLLAHVSNRVLVKVEPADVPAPGFRHICARGLCSTQLVYHQDRLRYPLKRLGERGEGKWQRVSWDEALDTIASKLFEIREKYGPESLAWAIEVMLYIRLAGALGGTMINPEGFGDTAGPCGDRISYGTNSGDLYTVDFENPGMCVMWGGNFAVTKPLSWRSIRDAKEKGAKLVAIDPRFTTSASKADEYISIRPGTDPALVLAMINVIVEKGLVDEPFVTSHTVGPFLVRSDNGLFLRESDLNPGASNGYVIWDTRTGRPQAYDREGITPALGGVYHLAGVECRPAFQLLADLAKQYPLEKASEITEVAPGTIEKLAVEYTTLKPVASYRGMGLQRTFHGDLSYRAISTLAAVTGNINLEGYSEGFHRFWPSGDAILFEDRFPNYMSLLQSYEAIANGQPYPIKALWLAGHNFMNQDPDNNKVLKELVPRLELIVVADMFMTTSAQYADFVLPTCSFFEYLDLVTPLLELSSHMQLRPKVIEPLYESRSDRDIVNDLGLRMGFGEEFVVTAEQYIERVLSSGNPAIKGVTLEKLKDGPVEVPPYDFAGFRTPSGRMEFYSEAMKQFGQELPVYIEPLESTRQPLAAKYPLSYLSTHTKYGNHSSFANVAWMRELDAEPLLEMNPRDAEPLGIKDGDMVVAFNDRGRVKLKSKIHQGIRPGAVNINEGWWHHHYAEGTHQALTHAVINPAQMAIYDPNSALYDNLVGVKKAGEE